ncbi:MAG TPA: CoA-binding protein, partial [Desulfobacterales bacterium]|nr:CoA-binding protein [Desulfobacterales bacterium]
MSVTSHNTPTGKRQAGREGRLLTDERDIRRLLKATATIAVLGLSPKPERDSHRIAAYLQQQGY